MTSSLVKALVCAALGALIGIKAYTFLRPALGAPPGATPPAVERSENTRTITRTITKEGAVKEIIVEKENVSKTTPAPLPPIERRKNIIGVSGRINGAGEIEAGPMYGRELFPNTFVTGSVLLSPKGTPKAIVAGIQINF